MIELRTRTVYSRDVNFSVMTILEKLSIFPRIVLETIIRSENQSRHSKRKNEKTYQKTWELLEFFAALIQFWNSSSSWECFHPRSKQGSIVSQIHKSIGQIMSRTMDGWVPKRRTLLSGGKMPVYGLWSLCQKLCLFQYIEMTELKKKRETASKLME